MAVDLCGGREGRERARERERGRERVSTYISLGIWARGYTYISWLGGLVRYSFHRTLFAFLSRKRVQLQSCVAQSCCCSCCWCKMYTTHTAHNKKAQIVQATRTTSHIVVHSEKVLFVLQKKVHHFHW